MTTPQPRYPIHIVSKGRWDSRLTAKALEVMNVPYRIVVEPQEFNQYAKVINPAKILVLPFANLGQGSIPARNWIWEHSIEQGNMRHWILDDNIRRFYHLNKNIKYKMTDGTCFVVCEDFVDRYENVAIAGMQYQSFAPAHQKKPPFLTNRRIYSCMLIDNAIDYRWRGRYNEDTDLSLRVLKDGFVTILFYVFLIEKVTTMTMRGGNESIYKLPNADGRLLMAQSLVEQHPDVTRIRWRYGRWQHDVNYKPFQNNLLRKRLDFASLDETNEYNMLLNDYAGI